MFIQRLVPEASKQSKLQPVSVSSPGLNELYVLPLWSWRPLGSPAPAAGRGREVGPPQRSSGHQGALRSPSPESGRASPVGVSLSLPLALSPLGLTSGSGARPPLSVSVRARRGPGRGAVNGGGGRRSGGRAQPRAPETLDSQPHNFLGSAAAPGVSGRGS